ncbi:MAG: hypothetical protein QOH68_3301, partial [Nocardioidaceae bacterium]|nr:hypothetical protein [Nocardioidaceae bacterium]
MPTTNVKYGAKGDSSVSVTDLYEAAP